MDAFDPANEEHAMTCMVSICEAVSPVMPAGAKFLAIVYTPTGQVIAGEGDPEETLRQLQMAIEKVLRTAPAEAPH
jgi:hypothetical protein